MPITNISILGTGTMGHGIAQLCAKAGLMTSMYGRSQASLDRGFSNINSSLKRQIDEGEITENEAKEILARITGHTSISSAVKDSDFVIEALAEDLELKKNIFNELDKLCNTDVILASNSSGLSPSAIAENTLHPERVLIAHFWNPPQLIPLVEIVPGKNTSKKSMDITVNLMEFIGKKAVRMEKECLGFIGNRLQLALLREALYIVEQGWAKPEEVDKAMEYGHGRRLPVTGPLCSADLGGLDIFNNISSYLFKDLCDYKVPPELLKTKVAEGKLGSKSGEGFYKWPKDILEDKLTEREEVLLEFLKRDQK